MEVACGYPREANGNLDLPQEPFGLQGTGQLRQVCEIRHIELVNRGEYSR
jgi:hypothetical protein